jgi:glutamine amidotransferase
MCRVVAYLGEALPVDVLLYRSDSALVRQAIAPQMLQFMNLAGVGVAVWSRSWRDPGVPLLYKDTTLPMYDRNLRSFSEKLTGECVIAHIRGSDYLSGAGTLARADLHPFRYDGFKTVLAHNGDLAQFDLMKFDLLEFIDPEVAKSIQGTTDSEWIYAVLVSQIEDPNADPTAEELAEAVERTLQILRKVRERREIDTSSAANLFVSTGKHLVATRFTFDLGCFDGPPRNVDLFSQTLWFTIGSGYGEHDREWRMIGEVRDADSILVASEPLTTDTSTWIEVPEYTMITATRVDGALSVSVKDIDL